METPTPWSSWLDPVEKLTSSACLPLCQCAPCPNPSALEAEEGRSNLKAQCLEVYTIHNTYRPIYRWLKGIKASRGSENGPGPRPFPTHKTQIGTTFIFPGGYKTAQQLKVPATKSGFHPHHCRVEGGELISGNCPLTAVCTHIHKINEHM